MQLKPVVDGVEREVGGAARVVRVEFTTEAGAALARRYGVTFTPTFLFFDRRGTLVETTFRLDREAALARLRA